MNCVRRTKTTHADIAMIISFICCSFFLVWAAAFCAGACREYREQPYSSWGIISDHTLWALSKLNLVLELIASIYTNIFISPISLPVSTPLLSSQLFLGWKPSLRGAREPSLLMCRSSPAHSRAQQSVLLDVWRNSFGSLQMPPNRLATMSCRPNSRKEASYSRETLYSVVLYICRLINHKKRNLSSLVGRASSYLVDSSRRYFQKFGRLLVQH